MDILLGGLAFTAIVFSQFATVVAVDGDRKRRDPESSAPLHRDHRAKLIWDSGS